MKLVKLIANLGYGSRKDVTQLFRSGRITDADGEVLYADDVVAHERIRVDDGTCPAGQIKEITGSKLTPQGVAFTRKCLDRKNMRQ